VGKNRGSLPPFPSAEIRIRILWWEEDPDYKNSWWGRSRGSLPPYPSAEIQIRILWWWKIRIIICWWGRNRGSLPPFPSAVIRIKILWWGEDPDYNLLVGKEQGIFAAISVSRDPD
jgi:hypothetical protein